MELDLVAFCDEELTKKLEVDESKYELKSIVIHSGGAYGGHYHAYIRDDLNEGNWNIELPDQLDAEPKPMNQQ